MKKFIVCLAHFCEVHGPTSIICTEKFDNLSLHASGTTSNTSSNTTNNTTTCLSCAISIPEDTENGVIQTIGDDQSIYISQQHPSSQSHYKVLRQIVMKCLSVETTYDDLKPIMFGDSTLGFAVLMSFKVKDNTARGSERKYALIVLGEDENEIMRSWDLITVNLSTFIKLIKDKIIELELGQINDINNNERFYRRTLPKPKNLIELLGDDKFFIKEHLWATNLLNHLNK